MHQFEAFAKIPRFFRDVTISEKIDGTNAQVYVADEGNAMPIDWSTMEEAQAACDAQLRADGVTIVEVKP